MRPLINTVTRNWCNKETRHFSQTGGHPMQTKPSCNGRQRCRARARRIPDFWAECKVVESTRFAETSPPDFYSTSLSWKLLERRAKRRGRGPRKGARRPGPPPLPCSLNARLSSPTSLSGRHPRRSAPAGFDLLAAGRRGLRYLNDVRYRGRASGNSDQRSFLQLWAGGFLLGSEALLLRMTRWGVRGGGCGCGCGGCGCGR